MIKYNFNHSKHPVLVKIGQGKSFISSLFHPKATN